MDFNVEGLFGEEEEVLFEEAVEQAPNTVRIQASGGVCRDVPVGEAPETDGLPGLPLVDVVRQGNFTWDNSTQFLIDGAYIGLDYLVKPGAVVTVVGNLKGG